MEDAPAVPLDVGATLGPLTKGVLVGEYRIVEKIGAGGMGTIYSAIHPLIGKRAAVKVLHAALCSDEAACERFVQEARAVNEIGHLNLVDVFSFGRLADGRSYLIMEWLDGQTLDARLGEPMKLDEAAVILTQVCEALAAAHAHGIVHRDLKPDNLFLLNGLGALKVKLLDFGVARVLTQTVHPTRNGFVVGTPDYLSPEQALGSAVDGRSDVYSLGVVAFEMLLGRRPFVASGEFAVTRQHIEEAPPLPSSIWPEIPLELEHLLLAMLEKEPERRPPLEAVRATLAPFCGSTVALPSPAEGVHVPSPGELRTRQARTARRRRGELRQLLPMLLVGVALGSLAGAALPRRAPPVKVVEVVAPAPAPTEARLALHVTPASARIELDGQPQPASAGTATLALLPDATHELRVSAPGHQPLRQSLVAAAGTAVELTVALKREPTAPRPLRPISDGPFQLRAPEQP
jgi:serine/threonine-protein kinase